MERFVRLHSLNFIELISLMQLGNWQIETASGGEFWLDGGAMFGVVPKPLWNRRQPSDEANRIRLRTNCVLARDGNRTVLIDTGYGGKNSAKEQEQMRLEPDEPLLASLAALNVSPEEIDIVLFSHLHFDHAGGGVQNERGSLRPTFPNATYVAARGEWEVATSELPELRGSYPLENLLPLKEAGVLRLVEDGEEVVAGLRVHRTGGHTRGHHVATFRSLGETAVYLGDLCPTHSHFSSLWCMAYDTHPLLTRRRKPELLGRAADENWRVLFDHDPEFAGGRIARDERREFVLVERYEKL
jgi:glyoxylase-like metal-dependent hydrolase (beta-lactamase superfamily II)